LSFNGFLLEPSAAMNAASDAEKLIEEGFDVDDTQLACHPP